MEPADDDLVVLLDDRGLPCGTAERSTVHGLATPLHLAFSCYIVNTDRQVLVTRRALSKRTWPGVWTNACCGHPQPGEPMEEALERRVAQELGAVVNDVRLLLPDFRYEAVDATGIKENEICPVYAATIDGPLDPDPAEVMETQWVSPEDLDDVARRSPWLLSPWSVMQIAQLDLPDMATAQLAARL